MAQRLLYNLFTDTLWATSLRYCQHREDAEEALMNGWLKIFDHISHTHLPNEASLVGWMRKITVNECLQLLRKKSRLLLTADDEMEAVGDAVSPIDSLTTKEINDLIAQLPIGYKTVFTLYVIEGYSHKEISELLQIAEGSSKSQLSKARKALSQLIDQQNAYYGLGKTR